jgi:dethiobiotin synthetase
MAAHPTIRDGFVNRVPRNWFTMRTVAQVLAEPTHSSLPGALFVAGTQTEVGKTFVCAVLLRSLRRAGIRASYYKPILTGGAPGDGASDPDLVAAAAGLPDDPRSLASLWFAEPASPHFAARLEGRAIDPAPLVAEARRRAARGPLVVEGCGGLAVPLTEDGYLVSDLAADVNAPVVLVARTRIGAIHETVVTIEHAQSRGLRLAGIVWNGLEGTAREEDSMATVERLTGIRRLASLPRVAGAGGLERAAGSLDAGALWRTAVERAA